MYISKLKIHGFKSFASRETLEFGQGITTIVGPNGCGKTNIVDAIRWVLGEQKYSILRSGKMEDIIFNGAKGIKPLSVSEVYLTVHNNQGKLPVEYTDVEIGRRVYRNGESEYFINKTPCRLKDIHNLFIDTGMGSDAYSVIELKMIEQILSETSDDRKRMFEEAAGINKYKQQKKSALRKFDATRLDLERVDDIIREVETKVHGLQLQLKRFKRHEKLTVQLKENDLLLAAVKVQNFKTHAEPLKKQIQDFHNQRVTKTSAEGQKESELKHLRESYRNNELGLDELQKNLRLLEEERENIQHDLLRWNEQVKSAESNIDRLANEDTSIDQKSVQQKNFISDYVKEISELEPAIELKLSQFKEKRSQLDSLRENTRKIQQSVDEKQKERWELQQKLSNHKSLSERTRSLLDEKKALVAKYGARIEDLEEGSNELAEEQNSLEHKKQSLNSELNGSSALLEALDNEIEEKKQQQQELSMDSRALESRIETARSQKAFYQELVASSEGFPGGVQYVLENRNRIKGLSGTVGDLFTVDDKYQKAVESSLGTWAGCLVADTKQTALKIVEEVNKENAGEVSILPVVGISKLSTPNVKTPDYPGLIGRASEMINIENGSEKVMNFLLSNVFIVEKLDPGISVPPNVSLVDLKGVLISSNLLVKNFSGQGEKSLLGRKKKIEELEKILSELDNSAAGNRETQESLKIELAAKLQEREEKQSANKKVRDSLAEVEKNIIRNHYSQSKGLEKIRELKDDFLASKKDVKQLSASLEKLGPEGEDNKKELEKMVELLEVHEKKLIEARTAQEESNKILQDARIELLNKENKKDGLLYQKRTAEETLEEIKQRQARINEEKKSLNKTLEELGSKLKVGNESLTRVQGKITKQKSIVELKRQAFNSIYAEIEALESSIRSEQKSREALLDDLKRCELQLSEIDQQKKMVEQRIRELYGTGIPSDYAPEDMMQDAEDLELVIDRIHRSIESIGPVNMAVQDEYEVEDKRLRHLIEQKTDLLQSEENLRESIQKIDRVARKQFKDTFESIKYNFEKLFTLFFEGGQASISLTGDPDPLEAEISIAAQPPGKRNSSLRALSAGEKALTAISLLFSIYQVKPSPYCILDEVDAPLDDTNVRKFTRVLRKFSSETQFIIVTHNKLTMESANYLYGVTMEQKGVSKLASVRFDGEEIRL